VLDDITVAGTAPPRARLVDRIGIVTRLLVGALLAMLLAVASVQFWTLRSIEENGLQRAQDSLNGSMAALKHDLAPLGTTWSTTADGQLALGTTKLNGRNDLVDAVMDVTGAAATILGKPYLAVYEPIQDAQAKTVGILFVGVPLADAQAFMTKITREAVVGALVIGALAALGYFLVLRTTVRPMTVLATAMRRIADGILDCELPYTRRTDQIGETTRALLLLRDTSARARVLEEQATAVPCPCRRRRRKACGAVSDGRQN
jgi:methyl-accepting chemotaxis protein